MIVTIKIAGDDGAWIIARGIAHLWLEGAVAVAQQNGNRVRCLAGYCEIQLVIVVKIADRNSDIDAAAD
jgi:hypothetical protein